MRWPWSKKGKASVPGVVEMKEPESPILSMPPPIQTNESTYRSSSKNSGQPLTVAEEPTMAPSGPLLPPYFVKHAWGSSGAIDVLSSVRSDYPGFYVPYPRRTIISNIVPEARSLAAPREDTSLDGNGGSVSGSDCDDERFRDSGSSSEDAGISHSEHLLQFLEGRWIELMRRVKIVSGSLDYSHWTTGSIAGIGYQGIIDTGAYGDVFQVTPTYFGLTLPDA
jgi:hypothetical protein